MATLNDITVLSDKFYALSVLTGQPIGTEMELQIKGVAPVLVLQQTDQPYPEDKNGRVLYDLRAPSGYITVSGSEEVWLKAKSPFISKIVGSKISVEVV